METTEAYDLLGGMQVTLMQREQEVGLLAAQLDAHQQLLRRTRGRQLHKQVAAALDLALASLDEKLRQKGAVYVMTPRGGAPQARRMTTLRSSRLATPPQVRGLNKGARPTCERWARVHRQPRGCCRRVWPRPSCRGWRRRTANGQTRASSCGLSCRRVRSNEPILCHSHQSEIHVQQSRPPATTRPCSFQ